MATVFGDGYELDVDAFELRHRGSAVAMEPQVFDVLAYLVERRDRVVTKEELLDNIWGDRFVSESALTSRLKSARRAVGDDGRAQAVIRTVHGRGYRFVAEVREMATATLASEPATAPLPVVGPDDPPDQPDDDWPLLGRRSELERLSRAFADPDVGGVLLTGPAGIGKTRLSAELVALAADAGIPTTRARGHAEATDVSLGALAHLLPNDLFNAGGLDGEFSRGVLLQRAMDAIEQRAAETDRLILFVDDVDRLDEFSLAVLSALVLNGRVFLVLTQRTDEMSQPALGHLVKDGPIERIEMVPLETETLDVLLYRVLKAPIAAPVLDHLLHTSGGLPGICRQLVEASIETGALAFEDGVWRQRGDLTAPPDLAALVEQRLDGLDAEHRGVAELLAVAGSLDLDIAVGLTSEELLDALDLRGMLEVTDVEGRAEVSLAHPLFGEVLRGRMGRLRSRRVREQLAAALAGKSDRPDDRLQLARWIIDTDGELEVGLALETARLALIRKDERTAERIVERLQRESPSPHVTHLAAEMHFRAGRTDEVEELLAAIDLDAFDEITRAQVIRRRVTNMFFARWEFQRALELLDDLLPKVSGDPRQTLLSHRVTLKGLAGRVTESVDEAEELLSTAGGAVRLELLRASAFGLMSQGRHRLALDRVAEAHELVEQLPRGLARPGLALAEYTEVIALIEYGDLARAREVADRVTPQAVTVGWLPMAVSRVAYHEGRPGQMRERLLNPLGLADALGFEEMAGWMRAELAAAALLEGDHEDATDHVNRMIPLIEDELGLAQLDMARAVAEVQTALGDRITAGTNLLEAAEHAHELGAGTIAFALLHSAAMSGQASAALEALDVMGIEPEGPSGTARLLEMRGRAADDPDQLIAAAEAFDEFGARVMAARTFAAAADLLEAAEDVRVVEVRERSDALATVDGVRLRL
ncbi:MAG: winged helix-turn-helix domain-containing protein [Actinomycetota bacterium]